MKKPVKITAIMTNISENQQQIYEVTGYLEQKNDCFYLEYYEDFAKTVQILLKLSNENCKIHRNSEHKTIVSLSKETSSIIIKLDEGEFDIPAKLLDIKIDEDSMEVKYEVIASEKERVMHVAKWVIREMMA